MKTKSHSHPPAETEDNRDSKDLSSDENADLCAGCTTCCTYITVEVDAPRSPWEYDQWIWALHHRNIEMYVEKPEAWFLYVGTVCDQLDPNGRCSIHGRHPVLCREYDPRSCERRLPLADQIAWFKNAYELEAWLQKKRPAHWKRLVAYRQDKVATPDSVYRTGGSIIPVASLVAGAGGRPRR